MRTARPHPRVRTGNRRARALLYALIAAGPIAVAPAGLHGQDPDELSKKLTNPISDLVSVPIQENAEFGLGTLDAFRNTINVQPVYPFEINPKWNGISRSIVPVLFQEELAVGMGNKF